MAPMISPFLRPSAAGAWTKCFTYIFACENSKPLPETADEIKVREEGLAAHWLSEMMLRHDDFPVQLPITAPNGITVDVDMLRHTAAYCGTIINAATPAQAHLHIEESVDCGIIHPGMTGSPDTWFLAGDTLHIFDLKYGYTFVEVYKNLQMTIYALAVANKLQLIDDLKVRMCIYQPRAITREATDRYWDTTVGWLRTNMLGWLQGCAVRAMAYSMQALSGSWCKDCPGRFTCGTYINHVSEVMTFAGSYVNMELTPASLGAELKLIKECRKLLEKREESLVSQVSSLIKNKTNVPGWAFKPSKGREAFIPGTEHAFIGAAKIYGVDVTRPITPAEARKSPKLPQWVIDGFTERPKSGLALSYVGPNEVEKEFSK